ncbi:MAG: hypothetical protein HY342_11370 [Candidatus Lambdaproteobacteria bacterium]|nr:hypothetical protein [Candidatus Lambdaproteobacteria bacterium]
MSEKTRRRLLMGLIVLALVIKLNTEQFNSVLNMALGLVLLVLAYDLWRVGRKRGKGDPPKP